MNNIEKISWRSKMKQYQAELREIQDFLSTHHELPSAVENALTIRQNMLITDIKTLRDRIRSHGDSI